MTDGVTVWCFEGAAMWALTDDGTGDRLPVDLGPWTLRKNLTIDGLHSDEAEALSLIAAHGFCCFDPVLVTSEMEITDEPACFRR